ncbi:unnamed protein product [Bursaphelenchus xylophilus]|uniref:(pine wood nematode) hypothetical protein n=1 Tax=Bursaphelenchus xylophilus TaxID=6326 RepID=A0A7I8WJQ8_BURXY|nr:unnamed protein product [Bursaphelenchus xylophilus]CAG9107860.1 unnamed protein product [Bursaphelenchus xylophilus]
MDVTQKPMPNGERLVGTRPRGGVKKGREKVSELGFSIVATDRSWPGVVCKIASIMNLGVRTIDLFLWVSLFGILTQIVYGASFVQNLEDAELNEEDKRGGGRAFLNTDDKRGGGRAFQFNDKRGGARAFAPVDVKRGGARAFAPIDYKRGGGRAFSGFNGEMKRAGGRAFQPKYYDPYFWYVDQTKRAGGRSFPISDESKEKRMLEEQADSRLGIVVSGDLIRSLCSHFSVASSFQLTLSGVLWHSTSRGKKSWDFSATLHCA